MRNSLVFVSFALGATFVGPALGQSAGVIQFVAGDVQLVQSDGVGRLASKGVPVKVGDTLATAKSAMAQLKMGDGAVVVVVPESRVTVAEFRYAGVEDGTEKVRYRLEHGGFRAVTGAIGRTYKRNYVIETPIAHMGVRGTDHETYYFPATGPVSADDAKPGAYNKVNAGKTFIRTGAGEVEIEPNQVGYVASANDVPVILPTVPGFFNRSIAPRNARPAADPAPETAEVDDVVQQVVRSTNGVRLLRTRGPLVTPGTGNGPLVGFVTALGGGRFGNSGNGVTVLGAASASGSAVVATRTVDWTTWQNGVAVVGGQPTAGSTHMISISAMNKTDMASSLFSPTSTNATYTYITGTGLPAPTNQLGQPATAIAMNVGVNFNSQMVTFYDLQATAGGFNWNVGLDTTAPRSIADFTGVGGVRLKGGGGQAGVAHGTFMGPQAENLITSFGLSGPANRALSGTAVLTQ